MKNLLLIFLLLPSTLIGQIFTKSKTNSSIVILPNGLAGKNNFLTDTTNVVLGSGALAVASGVLRNTVIGNQAINFNSTGNDNTAIGYQCLNINTTGFNNVGLGNFTLSKNTTGRTNLAAGIMSLENNTTGYSNTATGNRALNSNTTGFYNTSSGSSSLVSNTTGNYNTAIGFYSGNSITDGSNNTFLGSQANSTGNFNNATAIGANAQVNANNKIRIGDTNITVIEGQVSWSNPSDIRLKENVIYTDRLGLSFINSLKTVSYNYIADETKTRYDGFIAQDIEKTINDLDIPFSGLKKSDDGILSLAYSDFVMPLVNAIKEQQKIIDTLNSKIENQKKEFSERLQNIEAKLLK